MDINGRFRGIQAVVVTLILVSSHQVTAQQFTAQINVGLTSSQISGDGAYGFGQFGAIAGGEVAFEFNDDWKASFGIRFNQKGSRIYKTKTSINTYRLRVNYIEAPLLIHYSLDDFSFGAGPVLGIKVNQKERTQFGEVQDSREFDPLELGLEVNIGYRIDDKWGLRLLYQNSILAVRDHPIDQAYPPANFVIGSFHQKILDQGQYFTSLSLLLSYSF
jgi:hypothetical protein